jgi:hypothetical protein
MVTCICGSPDREGLASQKVCIGYVATFLFQFIGKRLTVVLDTMRYLCLKGVGDLRAWRMFGGSLLRLKRQPGLSARES